MLCVVWFARQWAFGTVPTALGVAVLALVFGTQLLRKWWGVLMGLAFVVDGAALTDPPTDPPSAKGP